MTLAEMRSVLITGCNRGIGLELVKNATKRGSAFDRIFAASRTASEELQAIAKRNPQIRLLSLDVTDAGRVKGVIEEIDRELGPDRGLDFLVNNAARNTKSARFEWLTMQKMDDHLSVNVSAPTILSLESLPLLKRADSPVIVNISSSMGCLSTITSGTSIPYRTSKAALNMLTKCLSLYLADDGIKAVSIHPGWVRTDMGGPKAELSVEESVEGIWKTVLDNWSNDFNGRMVDYRGNIMPW